MNALNELQANREYVRQDYDIPPEYMQLNQYEDSYVSIGTHKHEDSVVVGKPQDRDGHFLVTGGTGSGKSSCIGIPTLGAWDGIIVAVDPDGELKSQFDRTYSPKRPVKILNLCKGRWIDSGYDPFYLLRIADDADLVQNAREVAQSISPQPITIRDPYWIQSAQSLLTGFILYFFGIGANIIEAMSCINESTAKELIDKIIDSNFYIAKLFVSNFRNLKEETLTGIFTELCNKIIAFTTDSRIRNAFKPREGSINWEEDLKTHNIFLTVAADKLDQWDAVLTMILTQLIRTLERRPNMRSPRGQKLPPVLLLIDEFPRIGKIEVITNALATLRSKGVTIALFIQSFAQLDAIYGENTRKIIIDNCQYKAFLNISDPETQKYASDMAGTVSIPNISISATYDSNDGRKITDSIQASQSREPIIYPEEFSTLTDIILITPEGMCRVKKAPYYKNLTKEGR